MRQPEKETNTALNAPLPKRLQTFTKLLKEPVVTATSAYRTGSHPILQLHIAAEVSRSPKVGLVSALMREGRAAFRKQNFPQAIVKFLAVEELMRKYGGVLPGSDADEINRELQFLKVQFFLQSGQVTDACKILKASCSDPRTYLRHRRYSARCGADRQYWRGLQRALRLMFKTRKSGILFALLGYVTVMGDRPKVVVHLAQDLRYRPHAGDLVFESMLKAHEIALLRGRNVVAEPIPNYLVEKFALSRLWSESDVDFLSAKRSLSSTEQEEIEIRLQKNVVILPTGLSS